MESAKIAIFLLFFVAFLIVTRRIFSQGNPAGYPQMPPQPPPDSWNDYKENQPAVIGAELPFPILVPPVERLPNGRYNRPKILNYYFSNLDLKRGPENPRSFCDQFFIEFEAPESGARWTSEYIVATPFGLQDLIDQTGQSLAFDGTIIVVPRWDLAQVLQTVVDDMLQRYPHLGTQENTTEDTKSST